MIKKFLQVSFMAFIFVAPIQAAAPIEPDAWEVDPSAKLLHLLTAKVDSGKDAKESAAAPATAAPSKRAINLKIEVSNNEPGLIVYLRNECLSNGSMDISWNESLKVASQNLLDTYKTEILKNWTELLAAIACSVATVQLRPVQFRWESGSVKFSTKELPGLWQTQVSKLFDGAIDFELSVKIVKE